MNPSEPIFTVEPPPGGRPPRPKTQGYFGWLTALGILALKFGKTSLSMLFMIWIYSHLYGWPFSVGFILLIFVHEMGHVVAAKWLGIPVSAPLFIPFVGASIIMKQNPRDAWTEALMAYGGPLAGGLGAWACLLVGIQADMPWLIAIALWTFVMNLFNLIPIPPLDGGRICAAVSRWFWLVGLFLLGGAVLYFHAWGLTLIAILVLFMAFRRMRETFFSPVTEESRRYYQLSLGTRAFVAAFYLGLIAALLLGYWDANGHLAYVTTDSDY